MTPGADAERQHYRIQNAMSRSLSDSARGVRPEAEKIVAGRVREGCRATLLTEDGVPIEAAYRLPGAGGEAPAIVLAHGFSGALGRPGLQRAAETFSHVGGVVTFSFRGHGRSGGRSTLGDREVLDLDVAVRWARSLGHPVVATVGFSMGGSVVLRHAGAAGARTAGQNGGHGRPAAAGRTVATRVDAVVSVSAPARWYYRGTAPMRRLHWAVTSPLGRTVTRVAMRTRVHPHDWDPVPVPPVEAVRAIPPTPLLVVHGDRDAYFPLDHPLSLAEAAGPSCELWTEPGFGHAENAAAPELLRRIGAWILARAQPGAVDGCGEPGAVDGRAPDRGVGTVVHRPLRGGPAETP